MQTIPLKAFRVAGDFGGVFTQTEMLEFNSHDEEFCAWMDGAKVGDVWTAMHQEDVACVEATEAQRMTAALAGAKSLADLDALYIDWIGYSIVADDLQATEASVREMLTEYIAEVAANAIS